MFILAETVTTNYCRHFEISLALSRPSFQACYSAPITSGQMSLKLCLGNVFGLGFEVSLFTYGNNFM